MSSVWRTNVLQSKHTLYVRYTNELQIKLGRWERPSFRVSFRVTMLKYATVGFVRSGCIIQMSCCILGMHRQVHITSSHTWKVKKSLELLVSKVATAVLYILYCSFHVLHTCNPFAIMIMLSIISKLRRGFTEFKCKHATYKINFILRMLNALKMMSWLHYSHLYKKYSLCEVYVRNRCSLFVIRLMNEIPSSAAMLPSCIKNERQGLKTSVSASCWYRYTHAFLTESTS